MTESGGGTSDASANSRTDLSQLLLQCLTVRSWTRIYPIVQHHLELLGDDAFQRLSEMDGLARSDEFIARVGADSAQKYVRDLAVVKSILGSCRENGIIETFLQMTVSTGTETSTRLGDLLDQTSALTNPNDLPRRMQVLEAALALVERDDNPAMWAVLHADLGRTLLVNPEGDREDNYDRAVEHYRLALGIYTPAADPSRWAGVHSGLGYALSRRTRGDRADNLAGAIEHYERALLGYTRDRAPSLWASTHIELVDLYWDRAASPVDDDFTHAIEHAEQACEVFTEQDQPATWVRLQVRLAEAYLRRFFAGQGADNVEAGIARAEAALRVITREENPQQWARVQSLLGEALKDRQLGDRADNVERAIAHFESASGVYTRDAAPEAWSNIQAGLATCYQRRVHGDRTRNFAVAIEHLENALQVRTKEKYPYEWATLQHNLATTYWHPRDPNWAEFEDEAIKHSLLALEVRTKETYPYDWAATHTNLAAYYLERVKGNPEENISEAIDHAQLALEVRTRDAHPVDWAMNQTHLAVAFSKRESGDARGNLDAAIDHYRLAMQVYRPDQFPDDCRRVGRDLADLLFKVERWPEAAEAFDTALQASTILYEGALSRGSRTAEIVETGDLHHHLAYALARSGNVQDAAVVLERGRALGIRRAFGGYGFELSEVARIDPDALHLYEQARAHQLRLEKQERPAGGTPVVVMMPDEAARFVGGLTERTLTTTAPRSIVFDPERVEEFRALGRLPDLEREERSRQGYAWAKVAMQAALDRIRHLPGFERFEQDPTFAELARAVAPEWPMVFLVTTPKGSLALVLMRTSADAEVSVEPIWIDSFDKRALGSLLIETVDGDVVGGFVHAQIHPERMESILPDALSRLGRDLMKPLVARLQELGLARVVLVPVGYLGLLPLHAAQISADDAEVRYVIDALDATYAISGRATFAGRNELTARSTSAACLCGVGNPQPAPAPLRFGVDELREVAEFFPEGAKTALFERDATVANVAKALPGATHVHFACHCRPNWSSPMHSELELGDEPLAVWEVQYNYGDALRRARLVVLSACQSGMRETTLPDEAIGLPSAFLQAGVPAVVATLWPVDDLSSALLMTRFYEFHLRGNAATGEAPMNPVRALCRAQCWLRDISVSELQDYVRRRDMSKELVAEVDERFAAESPDLRPFAQSPFDWAPFVAFGL